MEVLGCESTSSPEMISSIGSHVPHHHPPHPLIMERGRCPFVQVGMPSLFLVLCFPMLQQKQYLIHLLASNQFTEFLEFAIGAKAWNFWFSVRTKS